MPSFGMHYLVHYMPAIFCQVATSLLSIVMRVWGSWWIAFAAEGPGYEVVVDECNESNPSQREDQHQGGRVGRGHGGWGVVDDEHPSGGFRNWQKVVRHRSLLANPCFLKLHSPHCVTNLLHSTKPSSVHTTPSPERFTSDVIVVLVDAYVFSLSHISSVV